MVRVQEVRFKRPVPIKVEVVDGIHTVTLLEKPEIAETKPCPICKGTGRVHDRAAYQRKAMRDYRARKKAQKP